MRSLLKVWAMVTGVALVCSIAINMSLMQILQAENLKLHTMYHDRDNAEFKTRKIGGMPPTKEELASLKTCLDKDTSLGTLAQAVVVTIENGSTFYLEQKPGRVGNSFKVLNCQQRIAGKKKES